MQFTVKGISTGITMLPFGLIKTVFHSKFQFKTYFIMPLGQLAYLPCSYTMKNLEYKRKGLLQSFHTAAVSLNVENGESAMNE